LRLEKDFGFGDKSLENFFIQNFCWLLNETGAFFFFFFVAIQKSVCPFNKKITHAMKCHVAVNHDQLGKTKKGVIFI
jgi:hypothetical protein